jgi:hypothetical protein
VSLPRVASNDDELWHIRRLDYRDSIARADHELTPARVEFVAVIPRVLRKLDDRNIQHQSAAALLYGVSPEWPWIWVGVGTEQLRCDESRPGYWSPRIFRSSGLRVDVAAPITEQLSYSVAANLDRVNEDGVSGDGRYFSIGLEARLTPALSLRASVSDGQSLQGGPGSGRRRPTSFPSAAGYSRTGKYTAPWARKLLARNAA